MGLIGFLFLFRDSNENEKVILSLFFFFANYDKNLRIIFQSSIFRTLHLTIMLHHPEGKLQSEEGSLANNWIAWNKYLHSIMEIICLEANYLQKIRKHSEQSTKHCNIFFRLAASVCYQVKILS